MSNDEPIRFMRIFVVDFYVPIRNSAQMAALLKDRLKAWRGKRSLKEAAADLGVDYPSYRKYETGKRTPHKLAMAELERRMEK